MSAPVQTPPCAPRTEGEKPHSDRNAVPRWARLLVSRHVVRAVALTAVVVLVASMVAPHADAQQVVNGMAEEWRRASLVWAARLMRNAQRLFVTLAGFEVVASAMVLLLKPKRLDEAAGGFVLKILIMSICFFSITSFELVVPKLFDSFVVAGQTAAFIPSLNPSQVAGMGIMLAGKMMAGAVVSALMMDQVTFVFAMVCAFLVALAFCGMACQIVYCLVEGYVVMSAGVFFLGFAAFRGTATLAENYLTYVMHSGIKIMMLYLLVPVGVSVIGNWPTIPPLFDLADPIERLIGVCIFCALVMFLPGSFASRITGGASLGIAQALRNN